MHPKPSFTETQGASEVKSPLSKSDSPDLCSLSIDGLGAHGEGVGHLNGYTVFVEGALPKEQVRVRLIEVKKRYARAQLLSIEPRSPDRLESPCRLFGRCGGCQLTHLSYAKQLEGKQQKVVDALMRIGNLKEIKVQPCLPSPKKLNYRNKIQLPIQQKGQALLIGLFEKSSHKIVEVKKCFIHCELGQSVYETVYSCLKESGLSAFDPITKKGELRHILIKSALHSKLALVILVTAKKPSAELFAAAKKILEKSPFVKGVIHNQNTESGNTILGKNYQPLQGVPWIEEHLCGLRFQISAASFFQVNPLQAEHLYKKALELANVSESDVVLDAYCGVGTLALIFSKHAKEVIGIENIPQAIQDARANAAINGINNTRFLLGKAETTIGKLGPIDIVLLNPPRKGCDPFLLKELNKTKPKQIIYISCDPATLARDLSILIDSGYEIAHVQPFDMFPQTAHVECIVLLKSKH